MNEELASEKILQNPKVDQAKALLLEALAEAQATIEGIRPAHPDREKGYNQILKAFETARGGALYYPYVGSGLGRGPFVELLDGSVKYDLICGIGPHYFGHSHQKLIEAGIESALTNTIMQGNLQQNLEPLHLMERLITLSKLDHCFLSTSGAMATENGLKLAFHKKKHATRVLAFEHCFMGRTTTLSQITDKPAFRVGLPDTQQVDYVPFYHGKDSIASANQILKRHLARHPGKHAVMCMELIQGEGGFNVGTKEFFETLMTTLKEHDIPILVDEVQTFGRTESLFAFQQFGLEHFVDIVCIGKVSQVAATLFSAKMKPQGGLLSQTFTASSSAILGAIAIIDDLIQSNLYGAQGQNAKLFALCKQHVEAIQKRHPHLIKDCSGVGAMFAFTPYQGSPTEVAFVAKELYKKGLITFIAGSMPAKIRMLLPTPTLTEAHIDEIFSLIEETLLEAHKELF